MKKTIITLLLCLFVLEINAQRPKMHLKAKLGAQTLSYVYKEDSISREYFGGIHGGFSFRIMHKKKMSEIGFDFIRNYIFFDDPELGEIQYKLNSFELPITIGYITVKKPIFKHFIYGGIVSEFKVKSEFSLTAFPEEEPLRIKPKDVGLINPSFHMRWGTQFDLAMFNFDLHYSLGLNKPVSANYRTQSHGIRLTLGLVF